MNTHDRIIGYSKVNSIELSIDALGPSGKQGTFIISPTWEPGTEPSDVMQHPDQTDSFSVDLLVTPQRENNLNVDGKFSPEDGGSLLLLPPDTQSMQIVTPHCKALLRRNKRGEMSMISLEIKEKNFFRARLFSLDVIGKLLDHLSYTMHVPIIANRMRICNLRTHEQMLSYVSPFIPHTLSPAMFGVRVELEPVYSLYRDALRSDSPYYRLLCFAKIMEGLLKELRASLNTRAREKGIRTGIAQEKVPDIKKLDPAHKKYVGQPIKRFYDEVVTKGFRDAAAHFKLDGSKPLRLSAPQERDRFSDMAILCEACVRLMISNHEAALDRIDPQVPPSI